MTPQPEAVDRYLSSCRHVELLRAVEVEFLAGDLTVAEFEAEIESFVALGLEPGALSWSVDVGRVGAAELVTAEDLLAAGRQVREWPR